MEYLFPGMNPYLENSAAWPNVYSRLIVAIANLLALQIRPKYRVVVEEAIYKRDDTDSTVLVGIPDASVRQSAQVDTTSSELRAEGSVAVLETNPVVVTLPMPSTVKHRYLEIRGVQTNEVITAIEVLSPVNKKGTGRAKYENKRLEILASQTNLVEIDLLHEGTPPPVLEYDQHSHYQILVSQSNQRPLAQLYPFNVQQAIPKFPIPLRPEDSAVVVDLKPLLEDIYDLSGYDLDLDYAQDPTPTWPSVELSWIDERLKARSLR